MSNKAVEFISALSIDQSLVDRLSQLSFSPSGTRRICVHESETSALHGMLVESVRGSTFPAHYHSDGDEVTIPISGRLEIMAWDKGPTGKPTRLVLGPGPQDTKIAFLRRNVPHTTKALGGNCVYFEVKLGPFKKDALVQVSGADLEGYES